ncbi:Peroxidase 5 [Bienertia sinuspersici]
MVTLLGLNITIPLIIDGMMLYNFNRTNGPDPTLDPTYAAQLQQQCPEGRTDANLVVPMDPRTPFVTDVNYY